ncbi:hypothetical protein Mal64_09070 [Pseudobythopirellula maris]|uniref:Probable pectate lyase C n=1 Tax=Pseudobythopirellula maris TaxID=2527991 RepID=A0A5C5ZTH2_9BACT|nr:hypothetical protein [Pseudobythopirellula maris]TWT90516.1 hypothetical protein Mal64_09070 [Pseudobythopirellula maris]
MTSTFCYRCLPAAGLKHALLIASLLITPCSLAVAQTIKAFPQAEGFGAESAGGRGGDVYHVTKLNDDGSSGTLRHGIESAPSSGRTIVFDVGGWIDINSKLGVDTHKRNITIAGQTAPGGIGVRGHQFSVGGDDIVVRHMRFRPGKDSGRNDSVNTNNNAERVIYDHVSAGFSYDENFSVQGTNVTLQYSTVSHGLHDHSAGSLLENARSVSMHHNLYAHNGTRNPKHRVYDTLDWVNNVVYNWNSRAFYMQGTDSDGFYWTSNIDGNYFIAGPNHSGRNPLSGGSVDDYGTWWGVNAYDSDRDSDHDGQDYAFGGRGFGSVSSALSTWSDTPYPVADEIWKDASTDAAYERVLSEFGATPWDRDEVDQLLESNVINRNGSQISHENQLVAFGVSNGGFGTLGGEPAKLDSDGDGIPDAWEEKHGTNVYIANNNGDFDADGFTDLEEYLNDIAAFKAVGPIEFTGSGRYAAWQNWARRWEPSRLDEVHIDTGVATVDAVGQKAGTLRIGSATGTSAELGVASGWLEVTDDLQVGPLGQGVVTQTGGEVRVLGGGVHIENGAYTLTGGDLATPAITQGAGGAFTFSGGRLKTGVVGFDLQNEGGAFSPVDASTVSSVGQALVQGDLTLTAGVLEIEIASDDLSDSLAVDGLATLGGSLEVAFARGYSPESGSWLLMTAAEGFAGAFAELPTGFAVRQQGSELFLELGVETLTGDYNGDGVVGAADFTVWRDSYLQNVPAGSGADGDGNGVVNELDYVLWVQHFGDTLDEPSASVPEPTALGLAVMGLLAARRRFRR